MHLPQRPYFAMPCATRASRFGNFNFAATERVSASAEFTSSRNQGVIAMSAGEPHQTVTYSPDHGAPVSTEEAAEALRNGPVGAFVVAGIAVGVLLVAWLLFYFLLFLPRGTIG